MSVRVKTPANYSCTSQAVTVLGAEPFYFSAHWLSRNASSAPAAGGLRLEVLGVGFDYRLTGYRCVFGPLEVEATLVEGWYDRMYCTAPRWLYNYQAVNFSIVLKTNGSEGEGAITYEGKNESAAKTFFFTQGWDSLAGSEA
eukprot:389494-Hanusia_phi.AAC.1